MNQAAFTQTAKIAKTVRRDQEGCRPARTNYDLREGASRS